MRWLDPNWSIVRWVRNWIADDEDEELNYYENDHLNSNG